MQIRLKSELYKKEQEEIVEIVEKIIKMYIHFM